MKVKINGQIHTLEQHITTIHDIVEDLRLEIDKIAIEQNRIVIPRSLYKETAVNDNDQLEIIQFIGGG